MKAKDLKVLCAFSKLHKLEDLTIEECANRMYNDRELFYENQPSATEENYENYILEQYEQMAV